MNTLMSWMVFLFTESRRWNWVLFSFSHKTKFLNPESIGPGTRRSCRYTIFPINCSLLTFYVYSLVLTLSWTAEGFLERVSCEKYCNQYPNRSLCPEKKVKMFVIFVNLRLLTELCPALCVWSFYLYCGRRLYSVSWLLSSLRLILPHRRRNRASWALLLCVLSFYFLYIFFILDARE